MSRTTKTQAARILHKDVKDIPQELTGMVEKLSYRYKGIRHGNNRHHEAKMKIAYRRQEKAKATVETRQRITQDLMYMA